MALASGLFSGPHVARDSGAPGDICVRSPCIVGSVDDAILLSRWAARIPRADDARIVVGLCDCLGALPRIDSTAVESLNTGRRIDAPFGFRLPKVDLGSAHAIA